MPRPAVDFNKPMPCGDSMLARLVFCEYVGYRPPLKGEYYVSGAIPAAYRAPNDLSTPHHVVRPTHYAKQRTAFTRGEPFQERNQR